MFGFIYDMSSLHAELTNSVDVLYSAGGEVVVQHKVNSFEVDSSGEQGRADQHPNLTRPKTIYYIVPLKEKKPQMKINTMVHFCDTEMLQHIKGLRVPAAACVLHG